MRILDFSDGFESSSAPSIVGLSASEVSVTPSGGLVSTDAQSAIIELQGDVNTLTTSTAAKLPLAGGTMSGDINMNSHTISGIVDPSTAQQAATKNYVDLAIAALANAEACYCATTVNLVGTYSNGTSGVGATITITATGAFTCDGLTVPVNSRVLVKDQSTGYQNGVYKLTTAGSGGVSPVLTRAANYNTAADMNTGV